MVENLCYICLTVTIIIVTLFVYITSEKKKKKKKQLILDKKFYLNKKYNIDLDKIIKKMKNKNVINIDDINDDELLAILFTSKKFETILKNNEDCKYLDDKVFCSVFLEPSTRTRCSFDSAILKLGSKVINITDMNSTSFYKGETVQDAFTILSKYVDGIIYRDSSNDNVDIAIKSSSKPIINAGNGTGEHPTQSLLDFYTIYNFFPHILEKDKNKKINIAFVGDLKNGRTVHSLSKLLSRYNVNFNFISCKSLEAPDNLIKTITNNLKINGFYNENSIKKFDNLEKGLKDAHIIYMTRIQKERFSDINEYNNYKDAFILDNKTLKNTRKDAKILHPLPRVNEIKVEVDNNPKSVYFLQAENGLYVRMALLYLIFS
ncbi:aspartate carbamoyltransferase, putative [Plasmodium gallinaceum]|uniref:aspartate carbamoyltransferase n=1 Tax=Plasmodium gallinaceum TaxID=5849 RepID=A0A1J1GRU6_PLAGA|nr:aspartate carbamoyltransferase, putative [Plasmodium gallinaceum]CRG95154.1 aspartate carbamoyltransferase, putative [Plasmodium gallinaceum]